MMTFAALVAYLVVGGIIYAAMYELLSGFPTWRQWRYPNWQYTCAMLESCGYVGPAREDARCPKCGSLMYIHPPQRA